MEFYETIERGVITANNKARFFLGMNVCYHYPSSFNSIRTRSSSIVVFTVSYSDIFVMLLLNAFSAREIAYYIITQNETVHDSWNRDPEPLKSQGIIMKLHVSIMFDKYDE
jgi:hypothetical protein